MIHGLHNSLHFPTKWGLYHQLKCKANILIAVSTDEMMDPAVDKWTAVDDMVASWHIWMTNMDFMVTSWCCRSLTWSPAEGQIIDMVARWGADHWHGCQLRGRSVTWSSADVADHWYGSQLRGRSLTWSPADGWHSHRLTGASHLTRSPSDGGI